MRAKTRVKDKRYTRYIEKERERERAIIILDDKITVLYSKSSANDCSTVR
jgi:hypothetical protein